MTQVFCAISIQIFSVCVLCYLSICFRGIVESKEEDEKRDSKSTGQMDWETNRNMTENPAKRELFEFLFSS